MFFAFADFSPDPVAVELRVEIVRDGTRGLTVTHVQPFRRGDTFAFTGELSRPARAAIFWIDATGKVELCADSTSKETAAVNYPEVGLAVPIVGPAGAEVIVVIASDDSFNAAEISEQLAALGPPPAFDSESTPHAVRFDAQSVCFDPEYRAPGTPFPIEQHTPTSHAELMRGLLRQRSLSFAGIILRHD